MRPALVFQIHGKPASQGSKRHIGNGVMIESAGEKLRSWREAVRAEAVAAIRAADGLTIPGDVEVTVHFLLARPKSHYRTGKNAHLLKPGAPTYCGKRPDIDKIVRSTLDALTAAGLYADDARVVHLDARKWYADPGGFVGAIIRVEAAP